MVTGFERYASAFGDIKFTGEESRRVSRNR